MKFNIEYYINKLENIDNDPIIIQMMNYKDCNKERYLSYKTFQKFIFLEAIRHKLNQLNPNHIYTANYSDDVSHLIKTYLSYEIPQNYSNNKQELQKLKQKLEQKLLTKIESLTLIISEQAATLSEFDAKKYNLLSDHFIEKIKYILAPKLSSHILDKEANFISILIDPSNSIFFEAFLDTLGYNPLTSNITYVNPWFYQITFLNQRDRSLFSPIFYPEKQSEKIIEDLNNSELAEPLKFMFVLINLHKFPENFFKSEITRSILNRILIENKFFLNAHHESI